MKGLKKQAARDENYYTLYTYGLSESYIFKKVLWWQSYNQMYLYCSRSEFNRKDLGTLEQNGLSFYIRTYNTLLLNAPHTLRAVID